MPSMHFDWIIVGAGPAGCVLASRLSESADRSVLLIDAGPDYGPDPSNWPDELIDTGSPALESHSWGYFHGRQIGERTLALPRGRVFGGCSSVNSCIWLHGSAADYDGWAQIGNTGWDYASLAPDFLGAERDPLTTAGDPGDHLVDIWRAPVDDSSTIERALIAAADELEIPFVANLNGSVIQAPGIGKTPKNVRSGVRLNAALTYLAIARERTNLTLMSDIQIDRVLFNGSRAVGVQTVEGVEIRASETILSAGAYGSPAILLRSGIGPIAHLHEMDIPVIVDLPGVGEHLIDHPYLAPYTSGHTSFFIAPNAVPDRPRFIETMIKARSRRVHDEIDLHLYPRELPDPESGRWILGFGVSLQFARSLGRVRLTSSDPLAPLDIDHRYFSNPIDLEALTDGVELVEQLTSTGPLSRLIDRPVKPRPPRFDRAAMQEIIRAEVGTTFHPSSTCRMASRSDPMAVVDGETRVRGTTGLRVVDASIFPNGPRCNLHAPTVAVAEHAARIILRKIDGGPVTPR